VSLSNYWLTKARKLRAITSVKHRTIAASLLRICLGTTILVYYAQHLLQREFLWGDNGMLPYATFVNIMRAQHNLSLYLLSASPRLHTLIFYLGMLVTIAFTLGYKTRISSVLFYVFTWSLYTRSWFLLTGGDNLLYLLAFYLMFADCGQYFSLDAWLRGDKAKPDNAYAAMLHNYAMLAIVVQLCLLYFTSAFFKTQGHMWQDGTAIYYILRANEFNLSPWAHHFYDSGAVVTLLTWGTVIFQMSWPFLIWNRHARPVMFIGALTLHSMIGYFMGLVWFSLVMISAELAIFSNAELVRFGVLVRSVVQQLWARAPVAVRGPTPLPSELTVACIARDRLPELSKGWEITP
jgi:hypothetical protein